VNRKEVSTNYWWVVLTPLKNMKVNGKDYPIYYGKKMFETTNQLFIFHIFHLYIP